MNHQSSFRAASRRLSALGALAALTFAFVVIGCGGGGGGGGGGTDTGGGTGPASVSTTINWPQRSAIRTVDAPSSALSAKMQLFRFTGTTPISEVTQNRQDQTAAYSSQIQISGVPTGSYNLRIIFFAEQNGDGAVVAYGDQEVLLTSGSNTAPAISLNKTITSLEVLNTTLTAGQTSQLAFNARDAQNNVIAVTPGSGIWTLVSGSNVLDLQPNGTAFAKAAGTASVRVTVDNLVSPPKTITVTAGGGGGTWVPGDRILFRVADDVDPTTLQLRYTDENGSTNTLLATIPPNILAVAPNPSVTGEFFFAATTSPNPGSDENAKYAIYKNSSLSLTGATRLTDPTKLDQAYNYVGTIQVGPNNVVMFTAAIGTDNGVYTMSTGGTPPTKLANADDAHLSVDGTKIVYSTAAGQLDADIWTMTVSGASKTQVTTFPSDGMDEIMPQWSKDGTKIAFAALATDATTPNFDIYEVNAAGGGLKKLTSTSDDEIAPTWDPAAEYVAYVRLGMDVNRTGLYKVRRSDVTTSTILKDTSIGSNIYWTNAQGRAIDGLGANLGTNLRYRDRFSR